MIFHQERLIPTMAMKVSLVRRDEDVLQKIVIMIVANPILLVLLLQSN